MRKGGIMTLVINGVDRITDSTTEDAKYGVN